MSASEDDDLLTRISGGTNYKGQIVYMAEGQGPNIPSEVTVMNPLPPYNTTGRFVHSNEE